MEDIGTAIMHGAEAGKLRAFVRQYGSDPHGLQAIADRHSAAASRALDKMFGQRVAAQSPARFVVRSRPGSR